MKIRIANEADIAQLVPLRIQLLKEVGYKLEEKNIKEVEEIIKSYFTESIPNKMFIAFIAELNGEIIATSGIVIHNNPPTGLNISGKEAYIMNMYTLPAYRRKGVAKELFELSLDYVKKQGICTIWLRTTRNGKELYKKYGFTTKFECEYMELKVM